jgi:hypothetical protein
VAENDQQAEYSISVTLNKKSVHITQEILLINGIEVIKIIDGEGEVKACLKSLSLCCMKYFYPSLTLSQG